jgi:hypothetical protein
MPSASPPRPRAFFRFDRIETGLWIFVLTRFLDANRFPLRLKTLLTAEIAGITAQIAGINVFVAAILPFSKAARPIIARDACENSAVAWVIRPRIEGFRP